MYIAIHFLMEHPVYTVIQKGLYQNVHKSSTVWKPKDTMQIMSEYQGLKIATGSPELLEER